MSEARTSRPKLRYSLSARLLAWTILFVMLAEVLIFTPSIARFRLTYLQSRISDAHLATLALEATPTHMVSPQLEVELLTYAGVYSVVRDVHGQARMLIMNREMPPVIDASYDLRKANWVDLVVNAFATLAQTKNRILRVIGPSPKGSDMIVEVVLDETPMRLEMYDYAARILSLSIVISLITAGLVYLSLQWLLVRPMRRITASMQAFRDDPEDVGTVIVPSRRRDEIGTAQRELASMQTELRAALHEKNRLASLGIAVTKINHDLRNILATAQLVSDRLAHLDDPKVRRLTPTLISAIDRAIALCVNTLNFAREDTPQPQLTRFPLRELIEDVGAALAPQAGEGSEWVDAVPDALTIEADRDQMFRVLINLGRNAFQAGARQVRISAERTDQGLAIEVADDGSGLAQPARERLFQPFAGSARAGGTGLGLAIARDLLRAHGGDIRLAESKAGSTRFVLTLPARRAAAE